MSGSADEARGTNEERLFGAAIARHAARRPTATALISGSRRWTYAQFEQAISTAADTLRRSGIGHGTRVLVSGEPRPQTWITVFALARLGAPVVPVHAASTAAEVSDICSLVRPGAVVGGTAFVAVANRVSPSVESFGWDGDGIVATRQQTERLIPPARSTSPDVCDTAMIAFTSGTSGRPKGVLLTHDNLNAGMHSALQCLDIDERDVLLTATPLAHIALLAGLPQLIWSRGATVVIADHFDPSHFIDLVREHAVTTAFVVTAMATRLVEHPRWASDAAPSLRWLLSGGGAPAPSTTGRLTASGVGVVNSYGLTETSAGITYADPDASDPSSAGRPAPGIEVMVVDEHAHPLSPGQDGELWARGAAIAREYLLPTATRGPVTDDAGWLHTGDRARVDGSGRVTVVGRIKDTIVSGGENIDPTEVEVALANLAGVRDVAVLGIPDARWGDVVAAFVVAEPDHRPTLDELRTHLEPRLSRYKLPRRLVLVDSIPRTSTGKVRRAAMAELARDHESARESVPEPA